MKAACQCGNLTATIDTGAQPMTIACHCRDCQRRSGSPFGVIAYFPNEAVTIIGNARQFIRPTDEGNTLTNGFCEHCGSTLYARASKYPQITGITLGCLNGTEYPAPDISVYEQSRHNWVDLPDDIPHHLRGRNS